MPDEVAPDWEADVTVAREELGVCEGLEFAVETIVGSAMPERTAMNISTATANDRLTSNCPSPR